MKCHVCGSDLQPVQTDLPFKVGDKSIVIVRDLPVHQCGHCREYLLDDPVMERVEQIIERVDATAELEIVRYAA